MRRQKGDTGGGLIDRAIATVAPGWALKRRHAQALLDLIGGAQSGYGNHGASRSANWAASWRPGIGDATQDIATSLKMLRARSRDLDAGGGMTRAAIRTIRTNVVGGGLTVRPRVDAQALGWSQEKGRDWQKKTLREFELWAESQLCDADRQLNFYELQQLAQLSWLASGDIFAMPVYRDVPGRPYALCIKLLEADRVCTPEGSGNGLGVTGECESTGNRIIDGVEIDAMGAVVAYHVASRNPWATSHADGVIWTRVPLYGEASGRANILHLMETERPEQYRGVPLVAPVIEQLKQLDRYNQAELINAVVSGMFTAFIETDRPNALNEMFEEAEEAQAGYALGNATILRLNPGERMNFANPQRPNSAFDTFVRNLCTQIGAALEMPRDVLLKEFGQSYSASRAALLEFWKSVRMRREWLTWGFCHPIYEEFLAEAVAIGRIEAPGYFDDPILRRAYSGAEWHGPTQGQLDPLKEANAAEKRLELGLSTREREAAEMNGSDWEANLQQLRREQAMLGGDEAAVPGAEGANGDA